MGTKLNYFLIILLLTFKSLVTHASTADYSVVVWNIEKAKSSLWPNLMTEISKNIDFALIQEAVDTESTLRVFDFSFNDYRFYESWSNHKQATGLLIASNLKPKNTYVFKSPINEPLANTPKLIAAETFQIEGKDLLIINIHAINFRRTKHFKAHIKTVSNLIDNHVGPVIFAGDFNTWKASRKAFLNEFMSSKNLSEAKFIRSEFLELDHVYFRGIHLKNIEQLNVNGSDHFPIRFSFDFL